MSLRLGGDGAITGCSSLSEPALTLSGLTVSGQIFTVSGTVAAPGVTFVDDNDTGIYSPAANEVAITTSGAERLRIYSSGIDFPTSNKAINFTATNSSTNSIECTSPSGPRASIDFLGVGSSQITDIVFKTSETFNTTAERMRIKQSTGDVGIGTSSPAVALDVSGEVRASTGILFGTDTAAANTLDDYEEGTWTAGLAGSTTAGSYTFSKDTGNYTKIGNLVKIDLWLDDITTVTAGTGSARITGLPFPVKTGDNQYHGSVRLSEWNTDAGTVNLASAAIAVVDEIGIIETRDSLAASAIAITDKLTNNAYIMVSITYMAA
jgi:hypothetical protein